MVNTSKLIVLVFCMGFISNVAFSTQQNFSWSKAQLVKIYKNNPEQPSFYCGCNFSFTGKKGIVNFSSCGYKVRKNYNRASRIEWEHVMPAYNFGSQLQCWQSGGRKNCAKVNAFKQMESDLHNIQPSVGEVNADRSNYRYSQFTNIFNQYGKCESAVDFKNKQFQPRTEVRGTIARAYFYMSDRYNIRLSKRDIKLMVSWDLLYPPTDWECKRNILIKKIQGNANSFITNKCH